MSVLLKNFLWNVSRILNTATEEYLNWKKESSITFDDLKSRGLCLPLLVGGPLGRLDFLPRTLRPASAGREIPVVLPPTDTFPKYCHSDFVTIRAGTVDFSSWMEDLSLCAVVLIWSPFQRVRFEMKSNCAIGTARKEDPRNSHNPYIYYSQSRIKYGVCS